MLYFNHEEKHYNTWLRALGIISRMVPGNTFKKQCSYVGQKRRSNLRKSFYNTKE